MRAGISADVGVTTAEVIMHMSWRSEMKRGALWALLVVGGAQTALADEPHRTQNRPPPAASSSGTGERTRQAEPAWFDLSVPSGQGRGVAIYRYTRADKKLVLVERIGDADAPGRTRSFKKLSSLADAKIAIAPEGPKSPPPPPPGGGDPPAWLVPEPEIRDAMQQLKAKEPSATEISIGQLPAASAPRK
jgi:hypothetical protein